MSSPISRRAILKGGGALLGAAAVPTGLGRPTGGPLWVPEASASPGVQLDPNHPTLTFTHEGLPNSFSPGTVLLINDNSVDDISNFFADDPDAASSGPDLDIVTTFRVASSSTRNGVEAGVRFVINEGGEDKNIVAACITRGVDGIGLAISTQYHLDSNYPVFVVAPWSAETTLRVRRTAEGAEIVEVNGLPPVPRAFLSRDALPSRGRTSATVEFGCPAGPARAELAIFSFESVRVVQPVAGTLVFTRFRVHDSDSTDRLRFRADFALGAGTDGIDPATEAVWVRLSTPSGGVFYPPPANDFNPITGFDVHGTAPRRRWSISPDEKARTGIERFDIDEDPNDSGGVSLRDATANVPAGDYSTVDVEIIIGDDELTGTMQLVESPPGSGHWREA
ncbi:MAG: hypothetical protein ACT4PE_16430 [Candidatus Eiseniibacteriota bacterium]